MRRCERRRHSRRILEPVANGDVFDRSEFSKAMRIAGSDIVEFDTAAALQSPAQAIHRAEHQRWILEFIQSPRKHDPKRRRTGGHGVWPEYVGVDPGPPRIGVLFLTRVRPVQPPRDEGNEAKEFSACVVREAFNPTTLQRIS